MGSFESTFLKSPDLIRMWQETTRTGGGTTFKRRFRLYLDGLDEVPSVTRQRELLEIALGAKNVNQRMQIVVTGREHVVGLHLRKFPRVRVKEFDEPQIHELARKWFENDDNQLGEFLAQIDKATTLRPLMHIPLLATLILGVYKNTKTLPESKTRLYEMFRNLMAGGWDAAKNIHRQTAFGPIPKITVLTRLAAMLQLGRKRDCNQINFKTAVRTTLPGLLDKWQRLLEEIVQDGLLIPTGLTFAFAHMSFQEFLAAKDLHEPSANKVTQAFREFLAGDDWWREVVTFYVGLSGKPKEIELFIRATAEKVLAKTADDTVKRRAQYLLQCIEDAFPGSRPDASSFEVVQRTHRTYHARPPVRRTVP